MSIHQEEIIQLERKLNSIKRQIENLTQCWERQKTQLLDQVRGSTSTSIQTTLDLVQQIQLLSVDYTKRKNDLEMKLFETRQTYFKKLQE